MVFMELHSLCCNFIVLMGKKSTSQASPEDDLNPESVLLKRNIENRVLRKEESRWTRGYIFILHVNSLDILKL